MKCCRPLTALEPILVVEVLHVAEQMTLLKGSRHSRIFSDFLRIAQLGARPNCLERVHAQCRLHYGNTHNVLADVVDVFAELNQKGHLQSLSSLVILHRWMPTGDDLRLFVAIKLKPDIAEEDATLCQLAIQFTKELASMPTYMFIKIL